MLTHLDHLVLLLENMGDAISDYTKLLGFRPDWHIYENQLQTAYFQTGNIGLEIIAPAGPHSYDHIKDILGEKKSALTSLAFSTKRIAECHNHFKRRGLMPTEVSDARDGRQKFRCPDANCHGIKTFILSEKISEKTPKKDRDIRLDHLVINTPNPDRAVAHYGARLDIRLALDRTNEDWGARFMFFKLGDCVLEIIHRLGQNHDPDENDHIWGLTWRTDDLKKTHKRLETIGVTVSEIRKGRKPGTQVFTVKSHTMGIPTLFLEQDELGQN